MENKPRMLAGYVLRDADGQPRKGGGYCCKCKVKASMTVPSEHVAQYSCEQCGDAWRMRILSVEQSERAEAHWKQVAMTPPGL